MVRLACNDRGNARVSRRAALLRACAIGFFQKALKDPFYTTPDVALTNEGICQFIFLQGNEPCETSYADKAGKYMRQRGVALPRL